MLLPIGYDNFQKVIEKKLDFVDKTLFIKEVIEDRTTEVAVITRPRRFGKTFNLSMLQYFLASEVYGKETRGLFDGLKISTYGNAYMQHQGQYPVVSVTFKDIKESNYAAALQNLSKLMSRVYHEHIRLLESDKLTSYQKNRFESVLEESANEISLKSALLDLTQYLYLHESIKPWLLMDEYDTPIQSGYIHGYYTEIIDFMRSLLGSALKTNPYLEKAVITGILRIAKESLFSGVNNLEVYSLLRNKYSEYFGFTEAEMDNILNQSDLSDKSEKIKQWYNGYKIGKTVIYNPWSIVNCVKQEGALRPYWVNTSDNQLVKDLLKKSELEFKRHFELLIKGESVEKLIDEHTVFQCELRAKFLY